MSGPVNAGKSSLVNAVAGFGRSLVSEVAGTTRDVIATRLMLAGWEIDLVDAAGIRNAVAGSVEAAGIERAAAAAMDADLVLRVFPADGPIPPDLRASPEELVVISKCDLATAGSDWPAAAVRTSAATGTGIENLTAHIVAALVPEETAAPDLLAGPVPFTERQVGLISRLRPSIRSTCHGAGA